MSVEKQTAILKMLTINTGVHFRRAGQFLGCRGSSIHCLSSSSSSSRTFSEIVSTVSWVVSSDGNDFSMSRLGSSRPSSGLLGLVVTVVVGVVKVVAVLALSESPVSSRMTAFPGASIKGGAGPGTKGVMEGSQEQHHAGQVQL